MVHCKKEVRGLKLGTKILKRKQDPSQIERFEDATFFTDNGGQGQNPRNAIKLEKSRKWILPRFCQRNRNLPTSWY